MVTIGSTVSRTPAGLTGQHNEHMRLFNLPSRNFLQHLSRLVVDNDAELRARYSHLTSKKRADLAITFSSDSQLYDPVSRQPRSDFIADVKMVSLVNSRGTWSPAQSRHKNKLENPSLCSCNRNRLKSGNMQIFMPLSVSLSFLLWSPVLALLVLLLFEVSFLWPTWSSAFAILSGPNRVLIL